MKEITLKNPLGKGDTKITKVKVRVPKAGSLRGIALADLMTLEVDAVLKVIPRVTSPIITEGNAENLSLPDLVAIGKILVGGYEDTEGNDTTQKP